MSTATEAVDQTQHTNTLISADDFAEFGGYLAMGNGEYRTCVVIDSDKAFERFKPVIQSGDWFVLPATYIPPSAGKTHGAWTLDMVSLCFGHKEMKPNFPKEGNEPMPFFVHRNFIREDRQRGFQVNWKDAASIKDFMVRAEAYSDGWEITWEDTDLGPRCATYSNETGEIVRDELGGGIWEFYLYCDHEGFKHGMYKQGVIAYPVTHSGNTGHPLTADELNIG